MISEKTKTSINTVAAIVIAACALLTLILQLMASYSIILLCLGVFALCAILAVTPRIAKRCLKVDLEKKPVLTGVVKWTVRLLFNVAVSGMAIGIISLCTSRLSDILCEVIEKKYKIIALETKNDVLKKSREDHEVVIASLVDSVTARKVVYSNALDQARDNGYVYFISERYLTSEAWRDKDKGTKLLTSEEKGIVEKCFGEHKGEDLYSLMYAVLSDDKMIVALQEKQAYDVPIDSKGRTRQLSAYDKIGVIGGYIGELGLGLP